MRSSARVLVVAATPSASEGPAAQGLDASTSAKYCAVRPLCSRDGRPRREPNSQQTCWSESYEAAEGPTPVDSLPINESRLSPRGWAAFSLVRGRMVGLGGLEPPTSSLSGIEGSALCGPAFPQVAGEREGRRDAFFAASFQAVRASQTVLRAASGNSGIVEEVRRRGLTVLPGLPDRDAHCSGSTGACCSWPAERPAGR
jgi:hypothetical protein